MTLTVQELIKVLQDFAPDHLAEKWDNVGLLIGRKTAQVDGILLALDPTLDVLTQAKELDCNTLITHHPAIFHALKTLHTDTPGGRFLAESIKNNISVIACHTNLDASPGGVSDVLGEALGLSGMVALLPSGEGCQEKDPCGLGRIGFYEQAVTAEEFIQRINTGIQAPWLLEAGTRPEKITSVAVCGGSCGDFAELAMQKGADVFLTSEVKHSLACWAKDADFWIIDGGHFATENPVIRLLQHYLANSLQNSIPTFVASQQPPLRLINT